MNEIRLMILALRRLAVEAAFLVCLVLQQLQEIHLKICQWLECRRR